MSEAGLEQSRETGNFDEEKAFVTKRKNPETNRVLALFVLSSYCRCVLACLRRRSPMPIRPMPNNASSEGSGTALLRALL